MIGESRFWDGNRHRLGERAPEDLIRGTAAVSEIGMGMMSETMMIGIDAMMREIVTMTGTAMTNRTDSRSRALMMMFPLAIIEIETIEGITEILIAMVLGDLRSEILMAVLNKVLMTCMVTETTISVVVITNINHHHLGMEETSITEVQMAHHILESP